MPHRFSIVVAAVLLTLCACLRPPADGPTPGPDAGQAAAQNDDRALSRASSGLTSNLARTTIRAASGSDAVLAAIAVLGEGSNGAADTVQPGAVLRDGGRVIADRQVNFPPNGHFSTAVGNAGHDAPELISNQDGSIFEVYGAASTYPPNHPPEAWACFAPSYCQPFKFAAASAARTDRVVDALASSPEYLLPTVGISEVSFATAGDATILGGQEQPSARNGQAGTQAYVTYHAASQSFDTVSGPWRMTAGTTPGDGMETISRAPNDDAYFDFAIMSAGGAGTVALTLPGGSCTLSIDAGSPEAAAQQIIATFGDRCPQLRSRYGTTAVRYDPLMRGANLAAVVGITTRDDVPRAASGAVQCSGSISCDVAHDVRGTGLHRHYLWGGIIKSGPYVYYLMDVQQTTGGWYAAAHNSYAFRLACFRTTAPDGARWTWTDCAGGHPFTVAPGPLAPDRVTNSPYVVRAPAGGYGPGMTPYQMGNGASDQVPQGPKTFAVISAESLTLLPDGRVLIVHGCQSKSSALTACYAILDGRTAQTQRAGLVDTPSPGSFAALAVTTDAKGTAYLAALPGLGDRWGCRTRTPCLLTYRFDSVNDRWQRISADSLTAAPTAGFPGNITAQGDRFIVHVVSSVSGKRGTLDTFTRPVP